MGVVVELAEGRELLSEAASERLASRIAGKSAAQAQLDHDLLVAVGEFDAGEGTRWFSDIRDTAHWLAWACSMAPGTAREHVRVARALRQMPETSRLMGEGRLSYSKVREVTRVVGVVDEAELCELALMTTASQLARVVRGFRAAQGSRLLQEERRRFVWREREDGMVAMTVVLPPEEAAVLRGAIDRAAELQRRADAASSGAETAPDRVDALLDVARAYQSRVPGEHDPDQQGDQHAGSAGEALVVVHVDSAVLEAADTMADVPAGTGYVEGGGPVEGATASRLVCTGSVVGARLDSSGAVLSFGRRRRLVSRTQRRALQIRARGLCEYPGCTTTHGLDAHHVVPWSRGGRTDLDNLVLLCRRHHVCVHEGGMTIADDGGEWRFLRPDGEPVRAPGEAGHVPMTAEWELTRLAWRAKSRRWERTMLDDDSGLGWTRGGVFPVGGGAGFVLADAVHAVETWAVTG